MMTRTAIRQLAFILLISIAAASSVSADEPGTVRLLVGRSAIVNTTVPITRVSLTSADIADALVTTPNQLLIQGKVPGTISMFVWDRGGAMHRYDVTVERDLSTLSEHMRELFPGETINVASNGKSVVVSGTVSTKYIAEKAAEVAAGHVEKKEDVVNLLQVKEGPPPQVLLRVRFAEVTRNALTELGASYLTGPNGYKDWVGRATTQQFPAPDFESDDNGNKLIFSDFLNLFLFNTKNQLGVVIRALQNRGLFQSLAEPNLVAESGKEASFLAGGEFPVPVAQAGGANVAISIMFKEFGVRLNFTPTVTAGNRVRLKVRPEVSTLDFANAVVLQGFRIPALSTRRTETELELANGQTFAIAGLLNNTANESLQKIPGIGDIPILGLLFRSKAAQKNRTELVVMITPEILPTNSVGVTNQVPRLQEPYLNPLTPEKSFPTPGAAFTPAGDNPSLVPTTAATATTQPPTPAPVPARTAAEEAAAVLKARTPKAPTLVTTPASTTTTTATTTMPSAPAAAPTTSAPSASAPAASEASTTTLLSTTPPASATANAVPVEEEVRPLTKEEKKRLEKAREEERKAEERRRKEEEKAAKQAQKDAEKAMKEAEKAAKRSKSQQ
jgi:pilus assembly protein CpaC